MCVRGRIIGSESGLSTRSHTGCRNYLKPLMDHGFIHPFRGAILFES
jgi:hypothetical protein